MYFLDRIKRYDEDIAQFVHEVDLAQSRLEYQLWPEEKRSLLLDTQVLLKTPLGKDLQAIALFVETGEGNPWVVNLLMQSLLKKLFSLPYVPGEPQSIPAAFWLHPVGGLFIKARCRIFDDQLITIAEAARLARVRSATISIAIDKGDLIGVTDPSARRRQGHRRVLRSEVIARWVEKKSSQADQPQEEWKVFEHRIAGGNQVVIVLNGIILNQWIHHLVGKEPLRAIPGRSWAQSATN